MPRTTPYGVFNFVVNINSADDPESELGGFSDVAGLSTETVLAEYRTGSAKENHVRKIPLMHKVGDVTLKRGIVNSKELFKWIKAVRLEGYAAKRDVSVTLRDEAGKSVSVWKLQGAMPLKYTGPTLSGKGGDVAMEELVISSEGFEVE
jgi:phage tail-like protein